MFEKRLSEQLKRIFDLDKVTYARPSESMEQEAIFIEVATAKTRVMDARQVARVTGTIRIFANADKLPYGFISKCVASADADDTKGLFLFNFEENKGTYRNIAERSAEFLYLFDSQYDPAIGTLNQVNLSIAES